MNEHPTVEYHFLKAFLVALVCFDSVFKWFWYVLMVFQGGFQANS